MQPQGREAILECPPCTGPQAWINFKVVPGRAPIVRKPKQPLKGKGRRIFFSFTVICLDGIRPKLTVTALQGVSKGGFGVFQQIAA